MGDRGDASGTQLRHLDAALLFACCVLASMPARAAPTPDHTTDQLADPSALPSAGVLAELYLEVSLNGEKTGLVAPFRQGPTGLRSTVQNLRDIGLDPQALGLAGQDEFALDAVAGLTYRFDAAAQAIDLVLADSLRKPVQLNARTVRPSGSGSADPGLLLNYDLVGQLGANARVAALNELRAFGPRGVLSTSGSAVLKGKGQRYIRYDTSWSWSDPATLQSVQVGDFVSPALNWTRALRMGGIQWRRNFDLRPDLLTYPLASLGGSAVVPSSVSLYVNGMEQYRAEVPGGPFVIDQVAGLNGAGQATVITRDALGRQVATSLPLYVDTRLMAKGLSDFALAAGTLRRDYGLRSFHYAGSPAVTGSVRHGLSDAVTLEAHAEADLGGPSRLVNGGAGAMVRLGEAGGILSGALAGSAGAARGVQASLGYQYIAPRFAVDLQSTRASAGYADLGTGEGSPVIAVNDRASVNLNLKQAGSASLSVVHYRTPGQTGVRLAALAWSRSLGHGAYLGVSGFQDLARHENRGFSATFSVSLGQRTSLGASTGRQAGVRSTSLSASRAPDFGGGWGWSAQRSGNEGYDVAQAQVQYLGTAGQFSATTLRLGNSNVASLGLSGSLVAMDGAVLAARHVGRGFALVSTGLADVPVSHENRLLGRTGSDGRLLVPDLMPYTANQIAIDVSNLPADLRLERTALTVVPMAGAGVVAAFRVERYRAATLVVHDADGKPLAVGLPVRLVTGGAASPAAASVVGYDGVVFLDQLQDSNAVVVGEGGAACTLHFDYQPGTGGQLPTIGPLRCIPAKE